MCSKDPDWFDGIYERYGQTIYSHALNRLSDKETAADMTQEAFISAFKQRHQFADELAVEGCLLQAIDRWCDWAVAKAAGEGK